MPLDHPFDGPIENALEEMNLRGLEHDYIDQFDVIAFHYIDGKHVCFLCLLSLSYYENWSFDLESYDEVQFVDAGFFHNEE